MSEKMKIWKLLFAVLLIAGLVIASPYGLAWVGFIPPIKNYAWAVMVPATVGILLKMIFGDMVSGEFLYYKYGYEASILTFGAVLSNLSLQLLSDQDLFPGISKNTPFGPFLLGPDPASQKRYLLLMLFILALGCTALTAYIARAAADPNTRAKSGLSIINFGVGSFVMALYVLLLITKE